MPGSLNLQIAPPPGAQTINPVYQPMHRPSPDPIGMPQNIAPPQHNNNAQNYNNGAMFATKTLNGAGPANPHQNFAGMHFGGPGPAFGGN